MIKLEKIEQEKVEEFCCKIYDKLKKNHAVEIDSINRWIFEFFKSVPASSIKFTATGDNLFQIMIADYKELLLLKQFIDSGVNYEKFMERMATKIQDSAFTPKSYLIKQYEKVNKKKFVKLTNVTVCPYCNRNFVSVTDEINNSQLDHFFPKSHNGAGKRSYPIFALSFYNLVPSCYGCNNKKSDALFEVSPYDEGCHSQDLLSFSWKPKPLQTSPWFDVSSIEVTMTIPAGSIYKSDFEKLDLQEQYQLHTDYVQELLWKKQIYSKSYREKMLEEFKSLGLVERDFDRVITGVYTDERDHGKRPLSKLVTDISREIGLLREKRE